MSCGAADLELEVELTGTTIIYQNKINITDFSDDANVTFFTVPDENDFTRDDIGSQVSVTLNVTNAFGKSSSCNLYYKLRGNPCNKCSPFDLKINSRVLSLLRMGAFLTVPGMPISNIIGM